MIIDLSLTSGPKPEYIQLQWYKTANPHIWEAGSLKDHNWQTMSQLIINHKVSKMQKTLQNTRNHVSDSF